jgi:hypothetical protein
MPRRSTASQAAVRAGKLPNTRVYGTRENAVAEVTA